LNINKYHVFVFCSIQAGAPFLKHRINDGHSLEYEIPGGAIIGKYGTSLSMIDNTQIFSPSFLNWRMYFLFDEIYFYKKIYTYRFSKL
jgi:hypothetical protein